MGLIPVNTLWPLPLVMYGNAAPNSLGAVTLDAAGEMAAFVFQYPRTGNVARLRFRTGTVTTGGTLRVALDTLAAGMPAETPTHFRNVTINAADDNVPHYSGLITDDGTDTGALKAVTRGQLGVITFSFPSYVAESLQVATRNGNSGQLGWPWVAVKLGGGAWAAATVNAPLFALEYDDGSYHHVHGVTPAVGGIANNLFQVASTPDERGNVLALPFACEVEGIWAFGGPWTGGATCDLVLYDGSGNVLASISRASNDHGASNAVQSPRPYLFSAPLELPAGTYRATIRATNGATSDLYSWAHPHADVLRAYGNYPGWQSTSRSDGGAWTDDPLAVNGIGLLVSAVHDGQGGGAGRSRIVNAGGI